MMSSVAEPDLTALDELIPFATTLGIELLEAGPDLVRARLARLYYAAGRQYFRAGQFRAAHMALAEAAGYGRSAKASVLRALAKMLKPFWGAGESPPVLQ